MALICLFILALAGVASALFYQHKCRVLEEELQVAAHFLQKQDEIMVGMEDDYRYTEDLLEKAELRLEEADSLNSSMFDRLSARDDEVEPLVTKIEELEAKCDKLEDQNLDLMMKESNLQHEIEELEASNYSLRLCLELAEVQLEGYTAEEEEGDEEDSYS